MGNGEVAVLNLNLWVSFSAQLPYRFNDFCHAAAIDGMIAAKSATVGVERQFACARNQIAVGDELAALAFLAKTEVLELHQDRDGEAVVDRGVFDILGRHTGLFECARTRPDACGVGEIKILAAPRPLERLAVPNHA